MSTLPNPTYPSTGLAVASLALGVIGLILLVLHSDVNKDRTNRKRE